eukprot:GHVR01097967.1.p1 GENE.GHVR01097967.1~~GHVR01097967.1.p1  ORF type:complete len:108 (+),score=1.71 GHVR01097967.1:130-453(+)
MDKLQKSKARWQRYYAANRKKILDKNRAWMKTEKGRSILKKYDQKRSGTPQRVARAALNQKIRSGKMKREPCLKCGAKAQAHHPDYAKPFAVIWVCVVHHREIHSTS